MFSTAILDIQVPKIAAFIIVAPLLMLVEIIASKESPAPDKSTGFTEREGNACLMNFF